jgi:hypothetical protein
MPFRVTSFGAGSPGAVALVAVRRRYRGGICARRAAWDLGSRGGQVTQLRSRVFCPVPEAMTEGLVFDGRYWS